MRDADRCILMFISMTFVGSCRKHVSGTGTSPVLGIIRNAMDTLYIIETRRELNVAFLHNVAQGSCSSREREGSNEDVSSTAYFLRAR